MLADLSTSGLNNCSQLVDVFFCSRDASTESIQSRAACISAISLSVRSCNSESLGHESSRSMTGSQYSSPLTTLAVSGFRRIDPSSRRLSSGGAAVVVQFSNSSSSLSSSHPKNCPALLVASIPLLCCPQDYHIG